VILLDANLLVYAHVKESERHQEAAAWLERTLNGPAKVGLPWPTLLAFVRLMGNAKVVRTPVPLRRSWSRVSEWLTLPQTWIPLPTDRHAGLLTELLKSETRPDVVNDAHLAALALEHGLTVCSTDRDFSRFSGIRWEDPLLRPPVDPAT
jgi:uncharacterized protein